jgi:hypothetical protein
MWDRALSTCMISFRSIVPTSLTRQSVKNCIIV